MNAPQKGGTYVLDGYGTVFVKANFHGDDELEVHFTTGVVKEKHHSLPLSEFNERKV